MSEPKDVVPYRHIPFWVQTTLGPVIVTDYRKVNRTPAEKLAARLLAEWQKKS